MITTFSYISRSALIALYASATSITVAAQGPHTADIATLRTKLEVETKADDSPAPLSLRD